MAQDFGQLTDEWMVNPTMFDPTQARRTSSAISTMRRSPGPRPTTRAREARSTPGPASRSRASSSGSRRTPAACRSTPRPPPPPRLSRTSRNISIPLAGREPAARRAAKTPWGPAACRGPECSGFLAGQSGVRDAAAADGRAAGRAPGRAAGERAAQQLDGGAQRPEQPRQPEDAGGDCAAGAGLST